MRELTPFAIVLGIVLAVVFGSANAYLGLKVGMTVSASIPAAVVSMGIMRILLRRQSIRENNIVQTMTSAGEALAAGVIFTVPALFILGYSVEVMYILTVALVGGILGVLAFIPFRKRFIEEDKELVYPEGRACADVLRAPESKGNLWAVVLGFVVGALVRFSINTLGVIKGSFGFLLGKFSYIALDNSPALLGVGYILGRRISSYILVGGAMSWLVILPLISNFKGIEIASHEQAFSIWNEYIRYIGAGAVLVGGILSFLKNIKAFKALLALRTSKQDLPMKFVLSGIAIIALLMLIIPYFRLHPLAIVLTLAFAFVFTAVSGRIVGIVGSSSNPISGMTIATLVVVSLILSSMGFTGKEGIITALTIGAVVCISAAIAGDTSQDLKTGFLVGASPRNQQVAQLLGVLVSALVIGWIVVLLNEAYGFGSKELPAPQAVLMSMILSGSFEGELPWHLLAIGGVIAVLFELLSINALAVAVGLYLPLELSTSIFVGSLLREILKNPSGIVYASGVIAGDALLGVVSALFVVLGVEMYVGISLPAFWSFVLVLFVFALPMLRR